MKLEVTVRRWTKRRPESTPFDMRVIRPADKALAALVRLRVRLVLSGHFHLAYVREHGAGGEVREREPPVGMRRAAGKPILVAQAASAISTRLRGEPIAYNWIEIDEDGTSVTVRAWDGDGWGMAPSEPSTEVRAD